MHDTTELPELADDVLGRTADRSRWMALVVLCAASLMIILDGTIVTVALPAIQRDLRFSAAGLSWVMNAYLIAFGGLLLLAGRLGDLAGRRNVFLAGLAVFTLASMVCGLAQSQEMLVGARFVQGIGGALTSAVILGVIVTLFPEPREMAKAIGVYAFVASAGGAVGLLAGGILTQAINWHWIFFVNLPIGIATAVLALRVVPQDRGTGLGQGADVPGALLITGVAGRTDAGLRRRLGGAAGRVRGPPADRAEPAHAAAHPGRPQDRGGEPDPGAQRGGHVRHVLPGRAVPAPRPGL